MPSVLRIAMFFFIFHVMIIAVNHIEIAPGYALTTGQIEPFQMAYDPIYNLAQAANNMEKSMSALQDIRSNGTEVVIPACIFIAGGSEFCIDLRQNPDAKWELLGASITYGSILLFINIVIGLLFAVSSMAMNFGLELLLLIIIVTVGAIPFWITLFSFIDPVFGVLLGVIVGGIQMVYIGIGIFKFLSAMIAGVSRFL